MILIDYSQVALSNILAFQSDLKKGSPADIKNLIRHSTLSTIKYYKKKYGKEYGEIIICCDGRHYWRRDVFPNYKAGRKKSREASDLDWNLIFDTLNEIRLDIQEHFPWKVIHMDRAEADDVIASLTYLTQEFGHNDKVMIVSSDKDFKQLHVFDNVKQWSPIQKKSVTSKHSEIKQQIIEHIVRGDSGDGIPNIFSADDVFVTGTKQKSVTAKRLNEFFDDIDNALKTEEERTNWMRNSVLIDFKHIPEEIQQEIKDRYLNNKPKGDKMSVFKYLTEHRCKLLLDDVEEF
jgi:5'-3' exonuclease